MITQATKISSQCTMRRLRAGAGFGAVFETAVRRRGFTSRSSVDKAKKQYNNFSGSTTLKMPYRRAPHD
jgi:hypothetical protein